MIKATIVCTNCDEEKEIPYVELASAVELDKHGELNLCNDCEKLMAAEMDKLREKAGIIRERFGLPKRETR